MLLGTQAGPPVEPYRTGIASAIMVDGSTYMIDCGRSSVTQFIKAGLTLASLKGVFLTHLHADHVADYFNLVLLGGNTPNSNHDTLPDVGVNVYGPGSAGGLPPANVGNPPTINPSNPTPGLQDLTNSSMDAYAYSFNSFLRLGALRDPRSLIHVNEIVLPNVGATFQNTAPLMQPFVVMEDDKVRVTATLVPHGPTFPSFAY